MLPPLKSGAAKFVSVATAKLGAGFFGQLFEILSTWKIALSGGQNNKNNFSKVRLIC
jgi:hypothetical protein